MGRLPLPVANLGHVDSILDDIDVVFLQFVDHLLFQVSTLIADPPHAVDGVPSPAENDRDHRFPKGNACYRHAGVGHDHRGNRDQADTR